MNGKLTTTHLLHHSSAYHAFLSRTVCTWLQKNNPRYTEFLESLGSGFKKSYTLFLIPFATSLCDKPTFDFKYTKYKPTWRQKVFYIHISDNSVAFLCFYSCSVSWCLSLIFPFSHFLPFLHLVLSLSGLQGLVNPVLHLAQLFDLDLALWYSPSQNDPYFKWHSSLLGKWNLCSCQPLWMSLWVY